MARIVTINRKAARKAVTKAVKTSETKAAKLGKEAKAMVKRAVDKVTGKEAKRKKRVRIAATVAGVAAAVVTGIAVSRARKR